MKIKRKHITLIVFFALVLVQSCKKDAKENNVIDTDIEVEKLSAGEDKQNTIRARVQFQSINDNDVSGSAIFKEEFNKVNLIALVNDLEKADYNMYIINNNTCSALTEDESVDWNPTNKKYEVWGYESGIYRGDIGNLKVDNLLKNGTLSFATNDWCLGCKDETRNIIGKSLVVVKSNNKSKGGNILCCGLIKEIND